jgi:hypothetical protein
VALGLALVVVGLAMTFSIVFVVPGIIVLLVAVATLVGGLRPRVRPPEWRPKSGTV